VIALSFLTLLVVGVGIAQWLFGTGIGRRQSRRLQLIEAVRSASPDDRRRIASMPRFALIPCLNEAAVIGATVRSLLDADDALVVVVVDDASDDATAAIVTGWERVHVVRRRLPDARTGKGAALNAGFRVIRDLVDRRDLDPHDVVVVVMDADGRLSDGAFDVVLGHFLDPTVGGLQLPVRIRNTERLIGRYQDFEFWGVAAIAQIARSSCGSTSLGGNGQFSRMSALLEIGDRPWGDALTEDLDLAISMLARGWRLGSTPSAHVTQQGVTSIRPLVTQRTRWMQGHMMAGRRIPELWACDRLATPTLVEVVGYLAVPWVLVLPWSVLLHLSLLAQARFLSGPMPADLFGSSSTTRAVLLVGWYLASFGPAFSAAVVYSRRSDLGLLRSVALSHLFVAFNYVSFVAGWRALGRIALGRNGWAKTTRSTEPDDVVDLRDRPSTLGGRLDAEPLLEIA